MHTVSFHIQIIQTALKQHKDTVGVVIRVLLELDGVIK